MGKAEATAKLRLREREMFRSEQLQQTLVKFDELIGEIQALTPRVKAMLEKLDFPGSAVYKPRKGLRRTPIEGWNLYETLYIGQLVFLADGTFAVIHTANLDGTYTFDRRSLEGCRYMLVQDNDPNSYMAETILDHLGLVREWMRGIVELPR